MLKPSARRTAGRTAQSAGRPAQGGCGNSCQPAGERAYAHIAGQMHSSSARRVAGPRSSSQAAATVGRLACAWAVQLLPRDIEPCDLSAWNAIDRASRRISALFRGCHDSHVKIYSSRPPLSTAIQWQKDKICYRYLRTSNLKIQQVSIQVHAKPQCQHIHCAPPRLLAYYHPRRTIIP